MTLTGLPLLMLAVLVTAACGTATVLLWRRSGLLRVPVRTAGILLTEASLVLAIGLVVNRAAEFYPSWEALSGQTGPAAPAVARSAGRLDASLHTAAPLAWRPTGVTSWRLASVPELVVPPGYADHRRLSYPVLLDLTGVHRVGETVTVHLTPTARTTAASLAPLTADLARDVRVSTRGWAIVAPMRDSALVAALIRAVPGRFVALALVGAGTPPTVGIPQAVAERDPAGPPAPAGMAVLHGGADAGANWAAARTCGPLAAPMQLPVGTSDHGQGRR